MEGEGHHFSPWGFRGGNDGGVASLNLARVDGEIQKMPSKVPHTTLNAGDRFVCEGPAGGGYGDPFQRDPTRVLMDVKDGLVSRQSAEQDYGVAITKELVLDDSATATLRQTHSGK